MLQNVSVEIILNKVAHLALFMYLPLDHTAYIINSYN
jgi:hypothetical protein